VRSGLQLWDKHDLTGPMLAVFEHPMRNSSLGQSQHLADSWPQLAYLEKPGKVEQIGGCDIHQNEPSAHPMSQGEALVGLCHR